MNIRLPWRDRLFAAFIFFTRLPFWRIHQPRKEAYETVVELWPLTGWLTAGCMAATLYFGSFVVPTALAAMAAIIVRILITGALHEDGLADFIDGFGGGGTDRKRILDIMKDSRIGTYGVVGLVLYFMLLHQSLTILPPRITALMILAADPFFKMMTAQLIQMMPYARTAETAKGQVVYRKISIKAGLLLLIQGTLPAIGLWYFAGLPYLGIAMPALVFYLLYLLMHRRINGYTGDCCGAVFLLTELTFYLTYITLNS
ncbi:adenosylcobinamide-GDP ribazoletransferase [Segatella maculosa]|uniref:Adenosylcobinamide-GDP ribazoletransferase n=1 Tax=Segatella maculosa OT 289 TaxID=999422 RepID=H1HJW2_9BACT|nr:adenosylcobinamide-GDP ribazoletransferase [Segatella maculosa]EHO73882.1 cobalamin 5'-phosphate synthase [Segatella maculosa OT 289]